MTVKPSDTYKTIQKASKGILYKEKKSKFYAYAFPISNEDEVKPIIDALKQKYPSASHVCYAWQLGVDHKTYRTNDDGEPNNTAGMPIYGQLQSFAVTNVLVAVVRFFGGTKLGVGGLISAYRQGAKMALETSKIVEKKLQQRFRLTFRYENMDIVMRSIKQKQLKVIFQSFELECKIVVSVRRKDEKEIQEFFQAINGIEITMV
ncbi:MAG: YigZ family protein [Pricia sp.]|nr:YigZ family protein [Pricia sp.]